MPLPVGLKMLLALTLSCLAFAARTVLFLGVLTAVNAGVFMIWRPKAVSWWRQGRYFAVQCVIIVVLYIIRFGSFQGAGAGLLISWQLFLAFWPTMVFVKTTSQANIVRAVSRVLPSRMSFVLATCPKRLFENSGSGLITRRKVSQKRSIYVICEHFETLFNTVSRP
jgi:energy-coupling factor transport system permease protein